jgi:probable DNA repair protein
MFFGRTGTVSRLAQIPRSNQLARSLYDITPLEPLVQEGVVLLTPNQRLARRIKSEWDKLKAKKGERVWEPLAVMPLESWLLRRWELAVSLGLLPPGLLLSTTQQLEIWQQVIAAQERDQGQYHLLRPAAAAELASQARETILRWQLDPADRSVRQQFGLDTDCSTFLAWLDAFGQRLEAAGQLTATDAIRQMLQCAGQLPAMPGALLEFDDVPPLLRAVAKALCTQLQEPVPAAGPCERIVHCLPDKRSELQAVAAWAAQTSRLDPTLTIGIVLSDMTGDRAALEYLLRREFDCLGANYNSLPVNFSTGIALDRVPVVRDALAVLALVAERTTVPAITSLLHSRFLHLPDADSALAGLFQQRLYDAGQEEISVADLRYQASEISLGDTKGLALGRHLLAVAGKRELNRRLPPSAWSDHFCEVLQTWGWPGPGPLDSLEFQQVELWYRTLDEFRAYDAVSRPMSFAAALSLLRNHCSRQVSQPQSADCQIQVLGPLEAAGLAFDHLWLVGMQAGSWPAAPRPNPFIPTNLQRELQMPHATPEREWAFAAGLLEQYGRATPELRASYCSQLDDIPELPSALLADFSAAPLPAQCSADPAWIAVLQQGQLEYIVDAQAPAVLATEAGSVSGGSGLVEDQSHCPFRAFARRRLLVEPLGEFSLALSPADRGSLMHDALFALWSELGNHKALLELDAEGEAQRVREAIAQAIAAVPSRRRRTLGAAYWELEGQRLAGLLHDWLGIERQRGDFVVHQLEADLSLALGPLELNLRVDRVDELPDGSRFIIDYKSGTSRLQDWLGERPAKPQLLLYGVAEPGAASALAFAQLRSRDSKFVGMGRVQAAPGIRTDIEKLARGNGEVEDWEQLNAAWRDNLLRLAAEFVAGDAAVDPLAPASCTWCGLQPLCRIGSAQEPLA